MFVFLFFSGAGQRSTVCPEIWTRAAEKQKEKSCGARRFYKQSSLWDLQQAEKQNLIR
jgi:hypothetical protein